MEECAKERREGLPGTPGDQQKEGRAAVASGAAGSSSRSAKVTACPLSCQSTCPPEPKSGGAGGFCYRVICFFLLFSLHSHNMNAVFHSACLVCFRSVCFSAYPYICSAEGSYLGQCCCTSRACRLSHCLRLFVAPADLGQNTKSLSSLVFGPPSLTEERN